MRLPALVLIVAACAVAFSGCGRDASGDSTRAAGRAAQAGRGQDRLVGLKAAVQGEPASADARFKLGQALLEQSDPASALIELEKAVALGIPKSQGWPPVARAMLALGQSRPLIDRFKGLDLPEGEASADLLASVAAAYAAQGQREPAAAAAQQALRRWPGHLPAALLQVRLLAASGDIAGAQNQLQFLLDEHADSAMAWQLRGDLLERQNAGAAAVALAYRRSIALGPDRAPARAGLVAALLRAGDVAAARLEAQAMRAALPLDPQTAFALAQVSFAGGDAKTARALAQTALIGLPNDPRLLQFAGLVALQQGEPLEAESPLLKSLQRAPETALTRHLLAAVYLATRQPGKLETVLEPLLQRADPEALQQRAQARQRTNPPPGPKPAQQATQPAGLPASAAISPAATAQLLGQRRLAQRDLPGARTAFEQALAAAPGHEPAALALAALDAQAGKPALAQARLQALLRRHPGNPQVRLAYASLLQAQGQGLAAEQTLQEGSAAMSGNAELLDALARLQLREHQFGQALRTLSKLAVLRPGVSDTALREAEAHVGLGETEQARLALQRALALRPGSLQAQRGLISLALLQGQTPAALALARQVQQQPDALGMGLLLEGDVQVASGNNRAAMTAYLDGLRRAPGTELAAKAHAALLAQGQTAAADGVAADWLRSHPRDADFLVHLGNGALARGDSAAAERNFQQAVRLQPLHGLALNNLAVAMLQQGQRGAQGYAEQAAALLPDSAEVADTLAAARRAENRRSRTSTPPAASAAAPAVP